MIYLDHAATTPLDPEVLKAMQPYFNKLFANSGSIHSAGQEALEGIDKARQQVAQFLNCDTNEIIFTSGATESNNLAITGIISASEIKKPHIITSNIEHPAILEVVKNLKNRGIEITILPVEHDGIVNTNVVQKEIKDNTILISIMYANNEIGTVQPIKEIGELIEKINEKRKNKIYFHTDATQAAGYLNCDTKSLKTDLLSLSGHKIYGPKGIGVLFVKKGTKIKPIQYGGHQEYNLRAGTLNTPGIVGIGKALSIVKKNRDVNNKRVQHLRDKLIEKTLKEIEGSHINGSKTKRLPNNANISFDKIEGESIMLNLDFEGIEVSTGSACASGSLSPSYVLLALGLSHLQAHGSIRFSFGKENTIEDVNKTVEALKKIIKRLRLISPIK